ncbi:MAG: hypothetical protein AAF570_13665, partial [Bacteroidota bacterium]
MSKYLHTFQSIPASGVKGSTVFRIGERIFLAFPQFSEDIPGVTSSLDSGNSDVDILLYEWTGEGFEIFQRIPSHGTRNIGYWELDGHHYIGSSCLRSGPDEPYNLHTYSKVYEWDGTRFFPIQQFLTHSAKNTQGFELEGRHFLAIANGELLSSDATPTDESASHIYEWKDGRFEHFQAIPSLAGFNWTYFNMDGAHYLIFVENSRASTIYKWDGKQFAELQSLDQHGGRHAVYFELDGGQYIAFANLAKESSIYKWDGSQFVQHQVFDFVGGHSFLFFQENGQSYLMSANYI